MRHLGYRWRPCPSLAARLLRSKQQWNFEKLPGSRLDLAQGWSPARQVASRRAGQPRLRDGGSTKARAEIHYIYDRPRLDIARGGARHGANRSRAFCLPSKYLEINPWFFNSLRSKKRHWPCRPTDRIRRDLVRNRTMCGRLWKGATGSA